MKNLILCSLLFISTSLCAFGAERVRGADWIQEEERVRVTDSKEGDFFQDVGISVDGANETASRPSISSSNVEFSNTGDVHRIFVTSYDTEDYIGVCAGYEDPENDGIIWNTVTEQPTVDTVNNDVSRTSIAINSKGDVVLTVNDAYDAGSNIGAYYVVGKVVWNSSETGKVNIAWNASFPLPPVSGTSAGLLYAKRPNVVINDTGYVFVSYIGNDPNVNNYNMPMVKAGLLVSSSSNLSSDSYEQFIKMPKQNDTGDIDWTFQNTDTGDLCIDDKDEANWCDIAVRKEDDNGYHVLLFSYKKTNTNEGVYTRYIMANSSELTTGYWGSHDPVRVTNDIDYKLPRIDIDDDDRIVIVCYDSDEEAHAANSVLIEDEDGDAYIDTGYHGFDELIDACGRRKTIYYPNTDLTLKDGEPIFIGEYDDRWYLDDGTPLAIYKGIWDNKYF